MVKLKTGVIITVLILLSSVSFAQNISVKAAVDSSSYEVGDYINYTITVNSGKGININPPSIKDSLSGAELIETLAPASEEKDNRVTTTFRYVISKYDSGDVRIPPIAVAYSTGGSEKKTVLTNQVFFSVHTMKIKEGDEIKDVKEPIKIPLDWKLILIWVLAFLAIAGIAAYLFFYFRRKRLQRRGIVKVIRKEPHEEALDALKALEAKKLWQSGRIKEYHSEITEIIRRYFEQRFHIPALEITTGELLYTLGRIKEAGPVHETTSEFLNNADLVKFAKFVPMDNINDEMMKQAYQIVKITVPVPAAAAESQEVRDVQ